MRVCGWFGRLGWLHFGSVRFDSLLLVSRYGETFRVNAISPGFFIAEQNRSLLTNEDGSYTDRGNTIITNTPMKRFGRYVCFYVCLCVCVYACMHACMHCTASSAYHRDGLVGGV